MRQASVKCGLTRRAIGIVAAGGLALALAGPAVAQTAKPKRIVTTFTILQDMAQNVAGEAATVESITKPGAEIHDYEPTPLDIVRAQAADLVLWNGFGLERWFEKFLQRVRDVPSAVLTDGIKPIDITEGPYAGRPNPHTWMSPANAVIYVENIRKALVQLDPANADTFNRNAAAYTAQLRGLDAPIREQLGRIAADRRWLVTCEGAFSYLTDNYGMKELSLWPVNSDTEGTPQQVRRVVDTVRHNGVPVLFCESTVSDRAMKQVARETGARFAGVLFVDSLTEPDGVAPTYVKLLEYNAKAITGAFAAAPAAPAAKAERR